MHIRMSVFTSVLFIRHISPFRRAYKTFTVVSPFSTSTAGEDKDKEKVKKYVVSHDLNQSDKDNDKDKNKEGVKKYVVSQEDLNILSTYKEIVGDLHISARFKVPKKDPWPIAFHGYVLGKAVSIINQQKDFNTLSVKSLANLKKLGFQQKPQKLTEIEGQQTFKLNTQSRTKNYEHVKEALLTYKSIYGDLFVSQRYIVPKDDPRYASHLYGMKLGRHVQNIRNNNYYSKHREELVAMGFSYESQIYSFEEISEALLAYKVKYGDLLVPVKYSITVNDNHFAEHLWGMQLGGMVNNIRNNDAFSYHKAELLAMGFQYENINRPPNYDHVKEALLTYKSIYGDLLVPVKYIVPEDDPGYTSHLHGMKLGYVVNNIRNSNHYSEHREELIAMGFRYENIRRPRNFEHVKEALLTYKSIYGDLLVSSRYIVPKDDPRYASHLHGMKLGYVVNNIRNSNHYSEHREELMAMGFPYERYPGLF